MKTVQIIHIERITNGNNNIVQVRRARIMPFIFMTNLSLICVVSGYKSTYPGLCQILRSNTVHGG